MDMNDVETLREYHITVVSYQVDVHIFMRQNCTCNAHTLYVTRLLVYILSMLTMCGRHCCNLHTEIPPRWPDRFSTDRSINTIYCCIHTQCTAVTDLKKKGL